MHFDLSLAAALNLLFLLTAPNTTMTLRTRNEETARYFLRASAEHTVTRRSLSMHRWRVFGYENYQPTDRAVEREDRETRALDEHIKNLPKGQMEILMTDDTRGTLYTNSCTSATGCHNSALRTEDLPETA